MENKEHNLQDKRCECCGYMTYHREHMGCIRAAQKAQQAEPVADTGIRQERVAKIVTVSNQLLERWIAFGKAMQKSGSELPRHLIADTEQVIAAAPIVSDVPTRDVFYQCEGGIEIAGATQPPAVTVPGAVDLLREMEWENNRFADACPVCASSREQGHTANCKLSAVLAAAQKGAK